MRVQIQGKTFDIALHEDHAVILENNKHGKRWIKFPLGVIRWVSDVFEHCSSFEDLSFEKRYGFLSWRISTRRNKWGWVLELSVQINGIFYSVFVPGESSIRPWSRFINSFWHVVSGKGNHFKHGIGIHSDASSSLISDLVMLPNRDFDSFDESRSIKEEVDGLLAIEYQCFTSGDASSSILPQKSITLMKDVNDSSSLYQEGVPNNSLPNSQEFIMESVGQVDANNVGFQDFEVSVMMEEAKEIREASLMSDNGFSSSGSCIDVVTSLPYFHGGRKKKKPSSFVVVQFIDPKVSEVSSSSIKPTVSARLNKRKRLLLDNNSIWDKLPQGVKKHPISKFSEHPSLYIDRQWVIEALELDYKASEEDIFKRMYQFQKAGKIKISKKVTRIPESIHNEGIVKNQR